VTSEHQEIRLSGLRGTIAERMRRSLHETAQLSFHAESEATRLIEVRRHAKAAGKSIGVEDIIISVLCITLKSFPRFNATIDGNVARISTSAHVSVAIGLPNGLVAPTIFDADTLTIEDIAARRSDLIARARNGQLNVREMSGGTITISNLGATAVRFFTPILNTPQVAILGIAQIASRPWIDSLDQVCVRPVLGLSLTVDHRFIDGEPAGAFLSKLVHELENVQVVGTS